MCVTVNVTVNVSENENVNVNGLCECINNAQLRAQLMHGTNIR